MENFSKDEKASLSRKLARGIEQLELTIDKKKQQLLLDYLEELTKWNKVYNLSGIKESEQMLSIHLLDSLSILPFIEGNKTIDVGTGAGLPGIPLAISEPGKEFYLLDSNGKKTRFLFQASVSLGLKNIKIINERVESYQTPVCFDNVISRAYSSLEMFLVQARHLLGEKSKLLAMKGQYPQAELKNLPEDFQLLNTHELKIPGVIGARHLLEFGRV